MLVLDWRNTGDGIANSDDPMTLPTYDWANRHYGIYGKRGLTIMRMDENGREWLTTGEAAAIVGMSRQRLDQLYREDRLDATVEVDPATNHRRYERRSIETWGYRWNAEQELLRRREAEARSRAK
ncbi:hypothetical protein [Bifidobacterium olomucense]|uniref:Helix-turn-helix domain-containing protein n=1 Tax=Bifidobacterium olomucense TaxID=2675324 RepID=A0A7Y0HVS9_9BIFI|nr:hypothetical protein [Bifidobacterium sp. DSM 109959]NMM97516.1 hypothetical protein [Bifidobacterium sp. DSM 109959]